MIHDPLPHPNEDRFVAEVKHDLRMVPSANVIVGRGLPELAKDIGLEAVGELALLMAFVRANGAAAAREKVIEASRAAYARPREEVEREMRSNQGWPHPDELQPIADAAAKPPEVLDERWAVERLAKEKVDYSLAVKLVKEYGAERCLRQLRLLPYRKGIKKVARYIVGAIQGDYAGPDDQSQSVLKSHRRASFHAFLPATVRWMHGTCVPRIQLTRRHYR